MVSKEELNKLYNIDKLVVKQIQKILNVTDWKLGDLFREYNIKRNRYYNFHIKEKDFKYYYYETNLTINKLCKKLNITSSIYQRLRKLYNCEDKGIIYFEKNKEQILKNNLEKRKKYLKKNKKIL